MSRVAVRNGTEGPRHDPYSFREYTVERPSGAKAVLHVGLGTWAKVRWPDEYVEQEKWNEQRAIRIFERVAGVSLHVLEKALEEREARKYRHHPCGRRNFEYARGFPGETFVVCKTCGEVIDSHFDRSAVE